MSLILQVTSVQVKYWSHASSTRLLSRFNVEARQKLDTSCICRELRNKIF